MSGLGDFSDYIVQEENGFLLSKEYTDQDIYKVIKRAYGERNLLKKIGKNLKETVLQKFSLAEETLSKYDQLLYQGRDENYYKVSTSMGAYCSTRVLVSVIR